MRYYNLASDPGICWGLVSDDSSGFCCSNARAVSVALSTVRDCFLDTFGAEIVNSHPKLAIISTSDIPMTLRKLDLIALSAKGSCYSQQIFQFSHELCHFMIPGDVCDPYRWWEETLCEMMSWYALHWVSTHLERYVQHYFFPQADELSGYIADDQSSRFVAEGNIPAFLSLNLPRLREDPYDRASNHTVAYAIYPLFLRSPELWRIVPELSGLSPDLPLREALSQLCLSAAVPHSLCDQLIQALCE